MTTRSELRDVAADVLRASKTMAGANVKSVSVLPTIAKRYDATPVLFVTVPAERKTSLGRAGAPKFVTTMNLAVTARVVAITSGADEVSVGLDIDTLVEQVEDAILGSYDLLCLVQHFADVETNVVLSASGGTPMGEATMNFSCELFQTYQPPLGEPLALIAATLETPAGPTLAEADIALPQS